MNKEVSERFDLALRFFVKRSRSNKKAAEKMNVHPSKISKLLNTEATPNFSFLVAFFEVASVSPNWVFLGEGEMLVRKKV